MKNKNIFLIIVLIILILIAGIIYINNSNKEDGNNETYNLENLPSSIKIIQYEPGRDVILKEISIDSKEDIEILSGYVRKVKKLSPNEIVNLDLLREIVIEYNEYITIGVQLGEEEYCYYTNTKENISTLSKMPKGLYEWVEEKINN